MAAEGLASLTHVKSQKALSFLDLVPNSLVGPHFLKKAPLKIMKWATQFEVPYF